jgi:glycosyltransferase involved in cell wall biosynthesis
VKRISCIIPAFNAARFLDEAVASVRAQSHPIDEILLVDDKSTDDTVVVANAHPDVILIELDSNQGAPAARNRGASAASGDLLAFLDADDVWLPHKIECQLSAWQEQPQWAATVTMMENFWIDELQDEAERFRDHRIAQPLPAYTGSTFMARRDAFLKLGGFDASLRHGDVQDWVLRARQQNLETGLVGQTLSRRRIHQSNTSRCKAENSKNEFLELIKRKLDRERARVPGAPDQV